MYLGTLCYMTSVYLRRIDAFFYIFLHILNTKHKYAYQVFDPIAGEIAMFYDNINTK